MLSEVKSIIEGFEGRLGERLSFLKLISLMKAMCSRL